MPRPPLPADPVLSDTVALGRHLADRLRTGDVVLTGADDPVSWIIQTGSRSPYSHVGLVTGRGWLIEAYDYALTPDETDEGVFAITLDDFLGRGSGARGGGPPPPAVDRRCHRVGGPRRPGGGHPGRGSRRG